MPRESEVEETMRKHLEARGFTVEERTSVHGVDISASKDGRTCFIEVQGNTKPDGRPFDTNQKDTHLLRAVGQLCLRLDDDPEAALGLTLPEDSHYRKKVDKMRIALKRLGVTVYFVDSEGIVEER